MQTLRRFRLLVALVAAIWLPMSAYAQICATQMTVAAIGGMDHPGMVQPGDLPSHGGHAASGSQVGGEAGAAITIVVDAETFWHSVDAFDGGCDKQSMCAFAAFAAVPAPLAASLAIAAPAIHYSSFDPRFDSRSLIPATPPPRLES